MGQQNVGFIYLSKKNVAKRAGVHPATIDRWVRERLFPRPLKVSAKGVCRWPERVVQDWESKQLAAAGLSDFVRGQSS